MSKSALLLFLAALASFSAAMLLPLTASVASQAMGAATVLFAVLFLLALIKGRRIKFDPLLR
jgi:hypothetical protein